MKTLINIFEEAVISQVRKDKIKTINGGDNRDLLNMYLTWDEEDGTLVCKTSAMVNCTEDYQIPTDVYDSTMRTAVRYLQGKGVNPEDGITFGFPYITIMFGQYPLSLTQYLSNSSRIYLDSERPTMGDVLSGHYERVSQGLPQLSNNFKDHLDVKYKRIKASIDVYKKGTFEGEPYELVITNSYPIHNFSDYKPSSGILEPDFGLVVRYKVVGNNNPSDELKDHISDRFKKLGVTALPQDDLPI